MLARDLVTAIASAIVGLLSGWLVRYAIGYEHRFTALEAENKALKVSIESLRAGILGIVEENKLDAKGAQDFTAYVRGEFAEHKYEIARLKERRR